MICLAQYWLDSRILWLTKMGLRMNQIEVQVGVKYQDKITSLSGNVLVGREDGKVEKCDSRGIRLKVDCFEEELDLLENETIKEGIAAMERLSSRTVEERVFVANERSIKLVRMKERERIRTVVGNRGNERKQGGYSETNSRVELVLKNVHRYLINGLSLNSCDEYMISSDLLRVNLWKVDRMEHCYNLVDIKNDLELGNIYVINSAKFSKWSDTLFGYCSSRGVVGVHDTKIRPESAEIVRLNSTRSTQLRSLSDFEFVDEYKVATRSLNKVAIYDLRSPNSLFGDYEIARDADLSNSDLIYEKFKVVSVGGKIFTGTTQGEICVVDATENKMGKMTVLEGDHREMTKENSIRLISEGDGILNCVNGGVIYQYEIDRLVESIF